MYKLKVAYATDVPKNTLSPEFKEVFRDDAQDTLSYMSERVRNINAWLAENHSEDLGSNAYVHEGTVERAWWHAGYQCGIAEMIRRLTGKGPDDYASNE